MVAPSFKAGYSYIAKKLGNTFEAGEILFHVTGKKKHQLVIIGESPLTKEQWQEIRQLVEKRLEGEPLQYLLGRWEFFSLPFNVGEGVLIPRPDTETLVEVGLELIKENHLTEVVDLCAGTGCVGISVEKNSSTRVTCVELSQKAFEYLESNAALNESGVTAIKADVLDYVHEKPINLVLSNPPYIPNNELDGLQTEVKREPTMALDGGSDGLDFYRKIAANYYGQIAEGGYIAFEIGINQEKDVIAILEQFGYENPCAREDLSGIIRVVWAKKS